jgi:hypothetical protein
MKYKVALISATVLANQHNQMAFVFEIVRHGARAPLEKNFV